MGDVGHKRSYKGWSFESVAAIQIGHQLPNSKSLSKRLGFGTARKITGWNLYTPEGECVKFCNTLKEAKSYVDAY